MMSGKMTKEELDQLAANVITTLPEEVQPVLTQARAIQNQLLDLRSQYVQELLNLEIKYEQLYRDPVFEPRKALTSQIPHFWKTVLLNSELSQDIQERDYDSLSYLTNIRCETFKKEPSSSSTTTTAVEDENNNKKKKPQEERLNGFTLYFEYDENPYFTNRVITKTFYFGMENGDLEIAGRSTGCVIDWRSEDKNLTIKVKVKKQVSKNGKSMRKKKITEPCDSFYNLFSEIPEDDNDDGDDDGITADLIEADHEIGGMIRDQIIPHALDYYLGLVMHDQGVAYGDEDDYDDEDEDDN